MKRCPNCAAHREDDDDFCPVCGETFAGPLISEAVGPPWYEQTEYMLTYIILLWPVALYGLHKRNALDENKDQWMLGGCIVMAGVWAVVLQFV